MINLLQRQVKQAKKLGQNQGEQHEFEQHEFDRKDILAFIIAMYKIVLPQLFLVGVAFFIIIYLLLHFWFD